MATVVLKAGQNCPPFSLQSSAGETVSLSLLAGKKFILYFYPAASTPGCTTQACDFRDNMASLISGGYSVFGVSKDKFEALNLFAEEESLSFPLLSDTNLQVHHAFGAYGEKNLYGKKVMGVLRSTFVVDENGKIQHALYNVKATGHVEMLKNKLEIN